MSTPTPTPSLVPFAVDLERERARTAADSDASDNGHRPDEDRVEPLAIISLEDFAAVDEPGADALVGSEDAALIPEGGDVMAYGDGGAGKTTLTVDLACHLAAGKDWIGERIARRARVLLIENEGPRALFRKKLRRKRDGWTGPPLDARVAVYEERWGEFTFAAPGWRARLAATITTNEIDVLIVGPVTKVGMHEAGTLQQVRDFMALVADVRALSRRRLTVVLIHHENKGGAVSGAWEGSGDTLLHIASRGKGFTSMHVQKSRWSSEHHKTTYELVWTDGEGFAIKDERNLPAEIEHLLSDGLWRTINEIIEGVGAGKAAVRQALAEHANHFAIRTGEDARALNRSPQAKLYRLAAQ